MRTASMLPGSMPKRAIATSSHLLFELATDVVGQAHHVTTQPALAREERRPVMLERSVATNADIRPLRSAGLRSELRVGRHRRLRHDTDARVRAMKRLSTRDRFFDTRRDVEPEMTRHVRVARRCDDDAAHPAESLQRMSRQDPVDRMEGEP